jgi:cysteine-rich repeat protein
VGAAASSEENTWDFSAARAIDGNTGTRWSSAYSDPQWIRVDLGGLRKVKRLILRWQTAASAVYDIQVSNDAGGPWTTVYQESAGTAAIKTITGLNASARYVRLFSTARVTQFGISLFELEVYGDVNSGCGTCGNGLPNAGEQCDDGNTVNDDGCNDNCITATCADGAKNQGEAGVDCGGPCLACVVCGDGVEEADEECDDGNTMNDDACSNACLIATCWDDAKNQGEVGVDCGGPCEACSLVCADLGLTAVAAAASSEENAWDFPASRTIDGNLGTRWSSAYADPQWLRVDLGAERRVRRVILRWEAAASRDYDIQVASSSGGPWVTVFHEGAGTVGTKTIAGLNANARYVRMYSNQRVLTQYGVSLFEVEVYGDTSPDCGP